VTLSRSSRSTRAGRDLNTTDRGASPLVLRLTNAWLRSVDLPQPARASAASRSGGRLTAISGAYPSPQGWGTRCRMSVPPTVIRFGEYEVDLAAGHLRKTRHDGQVARPGRGAGAAPRTSRQSGPARGLRKRLWSDELFVDFVSNLNTVVARLREVLHDSAEHPRFVETPPKRGYRFIGAVSECGPAAGRSPRARLVVLLFTNLTGDPDQEYLVDAITDETIADSRRSRPTGSR
jgi:hypothetical protein